MQFYTDNILNLFHQISITINKVIINMHITKRFYGNNEEAQRKVLKTELLNEIILERCQLLVSKLALLKS